MDEVAARPQPVVRSASAFAVRRWRVRDWVVFNLGLIIAVAIGYLHFTSPPPDLSPEAYDRIAGGMTWREVHSVVRAAPGGYGSFWGPGEVRSVDAGPVARWHRWGSPDGLLKVGYDAHGNVCAKRLEYHPDRAGSHPEAWPWWRRLWDRTVPTAEPTAIYDPF